VAVRHQSDQPRRVTPTAAIPLYGRSADNIRDHRNVTSMLHRIWTTGDGVLVRPTMSFDERGHRPNHRIYYVWGCGPGGQQPEAFFPTVEERLRLRSEEHTSELQSRFDIVCRLLLDNKKSINIRILQLHGVIPSYA